MTRQKDLKRIIRTRMSKTGEAYTTARTQVLAKPTRATPAGATQTAKTKDAKPSATKRVDSAVIPGMREALLVEKTGHTWQEWVRLLDADGAATMTHTAIAALVTDTYRVPAWWAQSVTLGYERIKGLREPGQRRSGEYEFSKTRTFNVSVTALFDAWANDAARRRWLGPMAVRRATPPKSMRLQPTDGTSIVVMFDRKGEGKSVVNVTHAKLPSKAASDTAKQYWSDKLDALSSWLAARKA